MDTSTFLQRDSSNNLNSPKGPKERSNSSSVDSTTSNTTGATSATMLTQSSIHTQSSNQTFVSHSHMMVDGESSDSGLSTGDDASDYLDDDLDEHMGPMHTHSLPQHDGSMPDDSAMWSPHAPQFHQDVSTRRLALAAAAPITQPMPMHHSVGVAGVSPRQSERVALLNPHHQLPQPLVVPSRTLRQHRNHPPTFSTSFDESVLLPADMGIDPSLLPIAPDECHTPQFTDVEPAWFHEQGPVVANEGPNHVVRMRIPRIPIHEHDPRSAGNCTMNRSDSSSSSSSSMDSPQSRIGSFLGGFLSPRKTEVSTKPTKHSHKRSDSTPSRSKRRLDSGNTSSSSLRSAKSYPRPHRHSRRHAAKDRSHTKRHRDSRSHRTKSHSKLSKTDQQALPDMSPLFELFGIDAGSNSSRRHSSKRHRRSAKSSSSLKHSRRRSKREKRARSAGNSEATSASEHVSSTNPRKRRRRGKSSTTSRGSEDILRDSFSSESTFLPMDIRSVDGAAFYEPSALDDILCDIDMNRSVSGPSRIGPKPKSKTKAKTKTKRTTKSKSRPHLADYDRELFDGPGPSLDIRGMIDFYRGQMDGGTPATYPPPHGAFAAPLVPTLPPTIRIPTAPSRAAYDDEIKWGASESNDNHVSPDLSARFAVPGHGSPFAGGSWDGTDNAHEATGPKLLNRRVSTVPANLSDLSAATNMQAQNKIREERLNKMFAKRPKPRKDFNMENRLRNWRDATRRLVEEIVCYDLVPESCKITVLHSQLPLHAAFAALVEQNVTCAPVWEPKSNRFLGSVTLVNFAEMLVSYHNKTQDFVLPQEEMVQKVADWSFFTKEEYKHRVAPVVSPEDNVMRMLSLLDSFSEQHVGVVQSSRNIICIADYLTVLHHVLPSWGSCGLWIDVTVQAVGWISATNSSCSSSTPLVWALQSLCESRHRAVVIVDEKKHLIDMLTVNDLRLLSMNFKISVGAFLEAHEANHRYVKCQPGDSCLDVLENMLQYCTDTAVVLDANESVLGLLTISHVFSVLLESSDFRLKEMRSKLSLMTRTSASSQLYTLRNCTVSTGSSIKALEPVEIKTNPTLESFAAKESHSVSDVNMSIKKPSLLSREIAAELEKHNVQSDLSNSICISNDNLMFGMEQEDVAHQIVSGDTVGIENFDRYKKLEGLHHDQGFDQQFTTVQSQDLGRSHSIDPHVPMYMPSHEQDLSCLAASSQKWYIPRVDSKTKEVSNIIPQYMS